MAFGRKRKAPRSGISRWGHKRGSLAQRRCGVAMHEFRHWLDGSLPGPNQIVIWSEGARRQALENLKSDRRKYPGCVPDRYWKLVEDRIRNLPLEDPEGYDRG